MKYVFLVLLSCISLVNYAQNGLRLNNTIVIGQFDKPEDRYTIEGTITSLLNSYNVKASPSVNYVRSGEPSTVLATDSLAAIIKDKGFDTYVVVSVRGYDRAFKPSTIKVSFLEKLDQGTLREIYRTGAVSVSFEFTFFRNGEMVFSDIVKCNNISDRDSVMKRLVKNLNKRVVKWKV